MSFTVRAAQLFLVVLVASLCYVVLTRRLKMAWALELAGMLLVFAVVGALDAVVADRPFLDREAVAARWLLGGTAAALVLGVVLWRLFTAPLPPAGRERRRDALVTVTAPAELGKAPPTPPPPRRRPWYRWRGGGKR